MWDFPQEKKKLPVLPKIEKVSMYFLASSSILFLNKYFGFQKITTHDPVFTVAFQYMCILYNDSIRMTFPSLQIVISLG